MERKIFAIVFLGLTSTLSFATGERQVYPKHKHSRPYAFSYGIKDSYAGNNYERSEVSDGDHVTGSYTVQLPDGRKQTVKYEADHEKGFVADVSYYGEAKYPPPQKKDHVIIFPPHELHNIKPIIPKYKPKHISHAMPIKLYHSEYKPSVPEFFIHQVPPINKPKLQKFPLPPLQHSPEIRPYKMQIPSANTHYKPSVPQHELFDKPYSPEYKPKMPHKPIRPKPSHYPDIPHKPISEYKPLTHKPIIPEYKPEKPYRPMPMDFNYKPNIPLKPIISEYKPNVPHKPEILEYKPETPFQSMNLDYESDIPHKPMISENKPETPFQPMNLDYESDIPHKPMTSEYKPEIPFQPMNLDYEPDIPHKPILEYKPDVPHETIIPEYESELPHIDSHQIYEDTIYEKVKAKRQKFPPYFPDKGPTKLPELSPFLTLKDIPLENSNIEENQHFKQSNAHLKPIHNLASISIYTPIKQSLVPNKNVEGLDPSIIAGDIPILADEHGNQPNFDTEPLFKDSQYENYELFPNSKIQLKESHHIARNNFPENNFDKKINFDQEQIDLGPNFRSDAEEKTQSLHMKRIDKNEESKNHAEKSIKDENETTRMVSESQQTTESESQLDQLAAFNSKKIGVKKFVRPEGAAPRLIRPDPWKPVVKRDMKSEYGEPISDNN